MDKVDNLNVLSVSEDGNVFHKSSSNPADEVFITSEETIRLNTTPPSNRETEAHEITFITAIPWVLTIIMPIIVFYLTRWNMTANERSKLLVDDIKGLISSIEILYPLLCEHQGGSPVLGSDSLKQSRISISDLRRSAGVTHARIERSFKSERVRLEWNNRYLKWKGLGDGESGLVTSARSAWSPHDVTCLRSESEEFLCYLVNIRDCVSVRRIRLR